MHAIGLKVSSLVSPFLFKQSHTLLWFGYRFEHGINLIRQLGFTGIVLLIIHVIPRSKTSLILITGTEETNHHNTQ